MVAGRKIKHITNAKAVIFNKRLRNEKIIVQLSTSEFKKSVKLYTIDSHQCQSTASTIKPALVTTFIKQ
jgi:hypothetical protein